MARVGAVRRGEGVLALSWLGKWPPRHIASPGPMQAPTLDGFPSATEFIENPILARVHAPPPIQHSLAKKAH